MVFAWTPSLLSRDDGGTTSQSQQTRPAGATPATKHGPRSRGGVVHTSGGGAEGQGRGWRRADSHYFFSSRGSSALGMSPAGKCDDHHAGPEQQAYPNKRYVCQSNVVALGFPGVAYCQRSTLGVALRSVDQSKSIPYYGCLIRESNLYQKLCNRACARTACFDRARHLQPKPR